MEEFRSNAGVDAKKLPWYFLFDNGQKLAILDKDSSVVSDGEP